MRGEPGRAARRVGARPAGGRGRGGAAAPNARPQTTQKRACSGLLVLHAGQTIPVRRVVGPVVAAPIGAPQSIQKRASVGLSPPQRSQCSISGITVSSAHSKALVI